MPLGGGASLQLSVDLYADGSSNGGRAARLAVGWILLVGDLIEGPRGGELLVGLVDP